MKFYIENTDYDKGEKLLKLYPSLSKYGFEIHQVEKVGPKVKTRDENGETIYSIRTYNEEKKTVNIDTLEQLLQFRNDVGEALIIHRDDEPIPCIEIYDNYRE